MMKITGRCTLKFFIRTASAGKNCCVGFKMAKESCHMQTLLHTTCYRKYLHVFKGPQWFLSPTSDNECSSTCVGLQKVESKNRLVLHF